MKKINLLGTIFISAVMLSAVTGCHRHPQGVTPIPDYEKQPTPGVNPTDTTATGGAAIPNTPEPTATAEGTPENGYGKWADILNDPNSPQDREKFKADTVYFDFDSATIKSSEESKLTDVATYFKGNEKPEALIVEGNCDERGTEKYNLSLGERRALAVREYLANLGVDAQRIKTVTYGASHPVDPGHDEAAWKQNRRDDFVLVTHK